MVWLVVMLVTGEVVPPVAPMPEAECRKVQMALAAGKRVAVTLQGGRDEHRVVRAECHAATEAPVS